MQGVRSAFLSVLVVALVITGSSLAVSNPAMAGADDREEIDADHDLMSGAAVSQYEKKGFATTQTSVPNAQLTVAKELKYCNLDDGTFGVDVKDLKADYVCFENNEDRAYTVRIFLPGQPEKKYWSPYTRDEKAAVIGDSTATFSHAKNGRYQAVEFTVNAGETVVFDVPEVAQAVYRQLQQKQTRLEQLTGWSMSRDKEPWKRIDPEALSGSNSTVRIEGEPNKDDISVQWDSDSGPEEAWINAPKSPDNAPVYVMEKEGMDNTVWVISTAKNPPPVRYKINDSAKDGFWSAVRDVKSGEGRFERWTGVDLPNPTFPWEETEE